MRDGRGDSRAGAWPEEKSRRTRWCAPSATWPDWRRAWAAGRDLSRSREHRCGEKSRAPPDIFPATRLQLEAPASAIPRSAKTFPELGVTVGFPSLFRITLLAILPGLFQTQRDQLHVRPGGLDPLRGFLLKGVQHVNSL